jgi:hypothetical protein
MIGMLVLDNTSMNTPQQPFRPGRQVGLLEVDERVIEIGLGGAFVDGVQAGG